MEYTLPMKTVAIENGYCHQFCSQRERSKLAEQKKTMRSVLSTVRATVLEGSFGNEKNHYLLNKVRARTQSSEIAWIFFGMLTANASISKRILQQQNRQRA
jgi:hypothetical protein